MLTEKKLVFELLLVAFSGVVVCDDSFGMRLTTESLKTKESTQYRFQYVVKDETTGDYKAQEETKRGDSVQGSYAIAEPNGDLRTVTYKAGPGTGFEAKVNVQPSGSPMKQTSEATTTTRISDPKVATTLESNVSRFPGGFAMNVTSPQSDVKTEMSIKFSMKANPVTQPVTDSTQAPTTSESQTAETTEEVKETTTTTTANLESPKLENSTVLTEGRDMSEDAIGKELDEALDSLPKLPELVLSDNKTRFKFHKDPEEALLDERITQIARQLAETGVRREYEERKLGHFIPISLSSVEVATPYLSKSFKLTGDDAQNLRPSEPSALQVLTQMKVVPKFVYGQPVIPRISPVNYRLPVVSRTTPKTEEQNRETITGDVPKVDKQQTKDLGDFLRSYKTNDTSVLPLELRTFLQFFSPYLLRPSSRSYVPQNKPESTTLKKSPTEGVIDASGNTTVYPQVRTVGNGTP